MESLLKLEDMGYVFGVDNTDIIYDFKGGYIKDIDKTENLFQEIKNNKIRIIDFLNKRNTAYLHDVALKNGYLPYAMGECYGKRITRDSEVFIQRVDDSSAWTAYRMTHLKGNSKPVSEKLLLETNNFIEALERIEIYINNYLDFIKKVK